MNFKKLIYSTVFLRSIFIISVFILIFISAVAYKHSASLNNSSAWLVHSHKVRAELERLITQIKNAESGQRGYLLTQDSFFLTPFFESEHHIKKAINSLKILTNDNAEQRRNIDSLNTLVNLRLSILINTINQNASLPSEKVFLKTNLIRGKIAMDNIQDYVKKIIHLETIYLNEREEKYNDEISFSPLGNLLLLLFSLTVFVFSYYKINKDLINQQRANKKLMIAQESISHAEEIGEFGSWQWDLQTTKLIYSDNQYRLLGCEPQSFEATLDNFLQFVHPEDKDKVLDNRDKIVNETIPTKISFRIIRKDGAIRYLTSLSKLLIDAAGSKVRIGINQDVTEQYLNNIRLEDKNHELEQSNKELASFNHFASHDLQEPLRKIQVFISRIIEKEKETLSETGHEYFGKILASANRMRILIDDLLLFSRTNKAEKVFENADLNELLENAKQECAQSIEEKKATIKSASLPTANVIPFQIQQLFINLIGNSLKYSKPNVAPLINIDYANVTVSKYPFLKGNSAKKYLKISVSDNGLGFEQQYAANIFNLFQRLHQDVDYPGTGIGLSICKKIIENHNGVITAKGVLDEGAEFTFFLPE